MEYGMRILVSALVLTLALVAKPIFAAETTDTTTTAADYSTHTEADHVHGSKGCTHKKVTHGDHTDYLHDGQYHAVHGTHYDNHGYVASAKVTDDTLTLAGHEHKHGPKCGHKAVKHGDHTDYEHDGHYHAMHTDHVDDHGLVNTHNAE
jgi:hypothetical protein